jgi:uncharacterized protein (TIGR03083 family)
VATVGSVSDTTPDQMIEALRALQDHVAAAARDLGDDGLAAPSGSSEWTVAHVLSHLGSGSEINVGTVQAALDGTPAPGLDQNQPIWDRWNAMSARDQRDGFLEWGERLMALYEAMPPEQRRDIRFDIGFLPMPADVVLAGSLRLNELALHGWDLDVAFDPDATLHPAGAALVIGGVGMLLPFAGKADRLAQRPVVIRVELTHPSEVLGVAIGEEQVAFTDDVPAVGEADVLLHGPTEAFVRLVTGRLAPEHTPGSVQVEGAATLEELRAVFPGF